MTKTSSSTLHAQRGAGAQAPAPRRGAARPELLRTGAFAGALALVGVAGLAGGVIAGGVGDADPVAVAVRLVLLVAGLAVAGVGLVRPLAGAPGRVRRRVAGTAGGLAAVAALAGHLHGDVDTTGTLVWVVAALAVPALLGARREPVAAAAVLPAGLVVVLSALVLGSGHTGVAFAADAVFAVAAAVALGVLVTRTPSADGTAGGPAAAPERPAVPRGVGLRGVGLRGVGLRGIGTVAGALAVLAAAARILTAGPHTLTDLLGTAQGLAALVALLLAVPAPVVVGVGSLRGPAPRAIGAGLPDGLRRPVAAAALAVAVAAAAVAGLLPAPAPAAVPGQALARTVALDGQDVPVLVLPMRPGPNLVQLGGSGYPRPGAPAGPAPAVPAATGQAGAAHGAGGHDMTVHTGPATVSAGGDPVSFAARPGARGGWAVVDVPAGTGSLTVTMNGDTATVPVDVGDGPSSLPTSALAGRDGPECASAVVGALTAGGPGTVTGCPAQGLDPQQADALRATVATMAQKGARTVRVVADPSPRSVAAARLVREEGAKAGLSFPTDAENDPNSALVVVSGWEQAVGTLDETAARARTTPTHLGGTFLAPWLLTGDVLRRTASAFLPLTFAPNEPDAQRYALALAATHPDTAPSASGYLAWARLAGIATDPRPSLYGAAAVNVPMSVEPPGSTGHHGGPDPASWFPGGTVVPVSGPMDLPRSG